MHRGRHGGLDLTACRAILTDLWLTPPPERDGALGDALLEELSSGVGERVFAYEWCSGGPGGGGVECVYRLSGRYFTVSAAFGNTGPYDSLDAALEAFFFDARRADRPVKVAVDGATKAICCTEWSDEELVARLDLSSWQPTARLELNGRDHWLEHLEFEQARVAE